MGLLEQVSKVAAVPVVFNNLGVLYAELNDKSRAINAFREALARDMDYRAVRLNLDRMKDVMALGADPVSREVESNNSTTLANIIAPGKAVEGEIEAAVERRGLLPSDHTAGAARPDLDRDHQPFDDAGAGAEDLRRGGADYGLGQDHAGAGGEPPADDCSAAEHDPVPGRFPATAAAPARTRCWCGP